MSVKSDVMTLCVPFGRLLENEALGNRKLGSVQKWPQATDSYTQTSDLVAQFGQIKMMQNASSIRIAPSIAKVRPLHFQKN